MKARTLIFAAAMAAAFPAAATAQNPEAAATPDANAASDKAGFGTLIASLQTSEQELAELQALEGVALADVEVVLVSDIVVPGESAAFDQALTKHREHVVALQQFLGTTDMTVAGDGDAALSFGDVLAERAAGLGDVVAVDVNGGHVTLFVLDDATEETAAEEMTG